MAYTKTDLDLLRDECPSYKGCCDDGRPCGYHAGWLDGYDVGYSEGFGTGCNSEIERSGE